MIINDIREIAGQARHGNYLFRQPFDGTLTIWIFTFFFPNT
jgi:hypothetical protein